VIVTADVETPFSKEGQELGALLRRKAGDEEIQPVIDNIQAQATEQALDPVVTSTEVFMTAVCWVGSKSLSHVLACIDRTKTRLLDAGTHSEAARRQILGAVMSYWDAHPGVALSIVEKLLNYSILTPFTVVDWAVGAHGSAKSLAQPHIYELVSNTVAKVKSHTRQIVKAPAAAGEDAASEPDIEKETASMKELFAALNDALGSWAAGSKDELMEEGDGSSEKEALTRRWGQRWVRVFRRMGAVEEAFVLEQKKDKMDTSTA
jgi:nuclear cap-binding protein subunit 1